MHLWDRSSKTEFVDKMQEMCFCICDSYLQQFYRMSLNPRPQDSYDQRASFGFKAFQNDELFIKSLTNTFQYFWCLPFKFDRINDETRHKN